MPTGRKNSPVYRKLSDFLKERFGERVYRVTVDGGFTCPNRDGHDGPALPCAFCDERGSAAAHVDGNLAIKLQYETGCRKIREKLGIRKFIPYFQSFTNTYAPTKVCINRYRAVLDDNAMGIAIGTRPDCIADDLLDWLGELSGEKLVILDLGVQSLTNRVLKMVHRGHDAAATFRALERLQHYPNIHTCVHLIFGLPSETREEMMEGIRVFTEFEAKGVKFHQLNVLKGTEIARWYREGRVSPLDLSEYVNLVSDFLERIPPQVVVHRLSARADTHSALIAPDWGKLHLKPAQKIEDELVRRNSRQGKFFGQIGAKPGSTGDRLW
ncbi:MAG: TIGR01212 family radical SAM protein [Acidobacteria bacterium]|nr:MAG: TIGR01212 family radical SAM protein [Acidobacteriota bacterium]RLE19787.1 MAG: TIGR01212 family radical SAM protein [Acidobacteriota bacterium]